MTAPKPLNTVATSKTRGRPARTHVASAMLGAFGIVGLVTACGVETNDAVASSDADLTADAVSMIACPANGSDPACPAGSFAVTCKNGSHEVATVAQIQKDEVCAPPPPPTSLVITDAYAVSGRDQTKDYCGSNADGALVVEGIDLPTDSQIRFASQGGYDGAALARGTPSRRCTTICANCANRYVGQAVHVEAGGKSSNTVLFHLLGGGTTYGPEHCDGGKWGGNVCSAAENGTCRSNPYPHADQVCDGMCWQNTMGVCYGGRIHY